MYIYIYIYGCVIECFDMILYTKLPSAYLSLFIYVLIPVDCKYVVLIYMHT